MVIFLILGILHLLVKIVLYLFISVWTYEFCYSTICNPLLSLFNLMLKLSQIWHMGLFQGVFLTFPFQFLSMFLFFWCNIHQDPLIPFLNQT